MKAIECILFLQGTDVVSEEPVNDVYALFTVITTCLIALVALIAVLLKRKYHNFHSASGYFKSLFLFFDRCSGAPESLFQPCMAVSESSDGPNFFKGAIPGGRKPCFKTAGYFPGFRKPCFRFAGEFSKFRKTSFNSAGNFPSLRTMDFRIDLKTSFT